MKAPINHQAAQACKLLPIGLLALLAVCAARNPAAEAADDAVRDYVRVRRGGLAEMSLQLPSYLKDRIHRTIREGSRTRRFVPAAFASGFVISVLELLCTGQVYLPTIIFVVGVPELRVQATLYLVLYNLMFILPLVGIFALAYFGTSSRDFTKFLQQRAGAIKLGMAVLFLALGGWLVYAAT